MEIENKEKERVILVGVDLGEEDFDYSMDELKNLAEACEMTVVGQCTQKMDQINKAHYIGKGKIEEIRRYSNNLEADLIVFYHTLTPSQLRNLQLAVEKPVMDRTTLILDIFSRRAKTREAKLQVETAKYQYLHSRLVGLHDALTRQGGTSGSMSSRGSGEKKLELDRRRIEHRLMECNKELEKIKNERETQRKRRVQSAIPKVSLVGYTNAGKSTILNQLVDLYIQDDEKKVLEKDMLFATLDTTVRKIQLENKQEILVTDTVGFIHDLPHGLVKAFRSTLEEIKTAKLIVQVVDYSDPHLKNHLETTKETLTRLGVGDIPVLYVYNKMDRVPVNQDFCVNDDKEDCIYISAKNKKDILRLVQKISTRLFHAYEESIFLIPYTDGAIANVLQKQGIVEKMEYTEEGIKITGKFHEKEMGKYQSYRLFS